MGMGAKSNEVFLIDFGLSKRFIDPKTKGHIRVDDDAGAVPIQIVDDDLNVGNMRFATIWMQSGQTQGSRRDDAMSMLYTLMYMGSGTLPWIYGDLEAETGKQTLAMKSIAKADDLCKELPSHFKTVFGYISQLKY